MPVRQKQDEGFARLTKLRKSMEAQRNEEWFLALTGRDIYEMDTQNLMNKTVVDRPVTLAMNNVVVVLTSGKGKKKDKDKEEVKSLDPETIMIDCMVDGRVVIRIRNDWNDLEVEDNDNIADLKIDGKGNVVFIRIQFQTLLENGKPGLWFRRDYRKDIMINIETGNEEIRFVRVDYPLVKKLTDFDKIDPEEIIITEIPFIPFVAQTWNPAQNSFFNKKHRSFLELERVTIEISGENTKHSRRKLMVKLPSGTQKSLGDLDDQINLLDKEGDAFYPDPHAAVINGFFKEQETQTEAIENATGVVATEKIVALSGVSRITAMKSLIDLAQKIRAKFIRLNILLETLFQEHDIDSRKVTVLLPPLGMMIVDVNNQDALLKEAHKDEHIDDFEFRESRRQMLGL